MFRVAVCIAGMLGFFGLLQGRGQTAGCTLQKQLYTCDREKFAPILAAASQVRIETGARDRVAHAKLRDLVVGLGKTVAPDGSSADLTFSLIPLESDGVFIGPAGTELAVLRVYGPPVNGERGNLVWAETLFGQPDISWPAAVQAVIQQFRSGFKR